MGTTFTTQKYLSRVTQPADWSVGRSVSGGTAAYESKKTSFHQISEWIRKKLRTAINVFPFQNSHNVFYVNKSDKFEKWRDVKRLEMGWAGLSMSDF